jgi:peptidoglycan endopeptidase LytE
MALNGIKDPKKLRAGDRIILPGKVNVSAPKPVRKSTPAKPKEKTGAAAAAPAAAGAEGTYQVKAGDSLSRIAVRHKTTSDAIRKANGLKSDKIIVGQKLAIPGAPAQEAAPAAAAEPAAPAAVEPQAPPPAPAVTPEAAPVNEMQELEQAPAPGAAPAAGAPQSTRQHTVAQGEDLYTVAMTYGVSVGNLKQLNGLNDTALTPGQLLKIPASE